MRTGGGGGGGDGGVEGFDEMGRGQRLEKLVLVAVVVAVAVVVVRWWHEVGKGRELEVRLLRKL